MLWARHCQKQLCLLQGVRDRASADAAAAEWDKEETLYYSNPVVLANPVFCSEHEQESAYNKVQLSIGHPWQLGDAVEAEKARLRQVYFYGSEQLAFRLCGYPHAAYRMQPPTPEALQVYESYQRRRFNDTWGKSSVQGGPGFSADTAWLLTPRADDYAALRLTPRRASLPDDHFRALGNGYRHLVTEHMRNIGGKTYVLHSVILVKDGESAACRLEQWYQLPQTYIDWHLNK